MKHYLRLLLVFMIFVTSVSVFAQSDELSELARETVRLMSQEDFKTVFAKFDDTMKKALPLDKLQETWRGVIAQCGPFQRQTAVQIKKVQQYDVTVVTCEFKNVMLDIQLTFNRSGQIAGLYFSPSRTETAKRPQEPKKPYPYDEKEVAYKNTESGITLAGTLTVPRVKGKVPAVLLISGSGQQDRDETILGHKPFLILADYLTRRGIAVLRVDDRGVRGSTGNPATATSEDFAGDVLAGVEFLKKRPEIHPEKIGLLGHSEGGLIAPMAAVKSKNVAFIILLAGPGLPGERILATQLTAMLKAGGKSGPIIAREQTIQQNILAIVKQEKDNSAAEGKIRDVLTKYVGGLTEEEKKALGDPDTFIKTQVQSVLSPWMRFYITYDPRPALSQVKCPVLALNGGKDTQVVPGENLAAIEAALKKGGARDYQVKELPNLNHLFQTCRTGLVDEYGEIEETMAPSVLKIIGDWVVNHTKTKR